MAEARTAMSTEPRDDLGRNFTSGPVIPLLFVSVYFSFQRRSEGIRTKVDRGHGNIHVGLQRDSCEFPRYLCGLESTAIPIVIVCAYAYTTRIQFTCTCIN